MYFSAYISAAVRGILLKLHTSDFQSLLHLRWNFGDPSKTKGIFFLGNRNPFSYVSLLPLEEFPPKHNSSNSLLIHYKRYEFGFDLFINVTSLVERGFFNSLQLINFPCQHNIYYY